MRNVEVKFRLRDRDAVRERAIAAGFIARGVLQQHDTFFRVARGKLKLREEDGRAELIYYQRPNRAGPALSVYRIIAVEHPAQVRGLLSEAAGVLAEVRKERTLLVRGNTRLHLDRVDGLGDFGEIECVLADAEDADRARIEVDRLLGIFGVANDELADASYFELQAMRAR